jgi:pimeloyl-ACP methyl ester carboxylesterase
LYDVPELEGNPKPKAFIHAEGDQFANPAVVEAFVARLQPARLWVVPGASHLFTEDLDRYEEAAVEAARWLLERAKQPTIWA